MKTNFTLKIEENKIEEKILVYLLSSSVFQVLKIKNHVNNHFIKHFVCVIACSDEKANSKLKYSKILLENK